MVEATSGPRRPTFVASVRPPGAMPRRRACAPVRTAATAVQARTAGSALVSRRGAGRRTVARQRGGRL